MNIPDTRGMCQYFLVFHNQAHLLLSDLSGLQWKEWKPPSAIVWERCFLSHPNEPRCLLISSNRPRRLPCLQLRADWTGAIAAPSHWPTAIWLASFSRFIKSVDTFDAYLSLINLVSVDVKPVLNWANVCSLNILRTVRRTMIRFLTELLVQQKWFGQFKLYFFLKGL